MALGVHPSGKLALAADAAGLVYMWDLTTAKCAFKHRTRQSAVIRWSPDGQSYASIQHRDLEVSSTTSVSPESSLPSFSFSEGEQEEKRRQQEAGSHQSAQSALHVTFWQRPGASSWLSSSLDSPP